MRVCVCVCVRAEHSHWVDTWGPAHGGSASLECVSTLVPSAFPPLHWETVPSTDSSYAPSLVSGAFSPLTLVKNVFPGAKGVVWSDNGSFQDQTKSGHKKEKKKTEIIKSFEKIFVTYLIFKKSPICLISYWLFPRIGGGLVGRSACVGTGVRHRWPLCLVFKASIFLGIKPHSLLTLLDITRPPWGYGQLGLDGQVSA